MALEIGMGQIGDIPVVTLTGRAVDIDVKRMARRMDSLYRKKSLRIVIDVSAVDFMDSHGLGTIVYYHTLLQKDKRELVLLNANPNPNSYLCRLFELTHLDKVLKIVSNVKDVIVSSPRPSPQPG